MEKEYLTKENYEELQKKLDSLYQKGIELAEVTNKSEEEYKILSDAVDTLEYNINDLERQNNNYINTNTNILKQKLYKITCSVALFNTLIAVALVLLLNELNVAPSIIFSLLFGDGLFGSIGCIVLMDKISKKRISKKEKALREEIEKKSKIKELKEEYSSKLKENNVLWKKHLENNDSYSNILSEIESLEEQISDFEREFTNIYLSQIQEENTISKPKTKALVKPNN